MSVNKNGNLRPDGISVAVPNIWPIGKLGATYYWNPGSSTAPHLTFTRGIGLPELGLHAVFLRNGMTSQDTLGHGISGNVSTVVPSVTINSKIPEDDDIIPRPWKSRVSSIETGIGTPNASPAVTSTYSTQQIADFIKKYIFSPAMSPGYENYSLPAFQYGTGTLGQSNTEPPVRFLGSQLLNPLGAGMSGWPSSVDSINPRSSTQPAPLGERPGGLPGLIWDHLQDN